MKSPQPKVCPPVFHCLPTVFSSQSPAMERNYIKYMYSSTFLMHLYWTVSTFCQFILPLHYTVEAKIVIIININIYNNFTTVVSSHFCRFHSASQPQSSTFLHWFNLSTTRLKNMYILIISQIYNQSAPGIQYTHTHTWIYAWWYVWDILTMILLYQVWLVGTFSNTASHKPVYSHWRRKSWKNGSQTRGCFFKTHRMRLNDSP